MNDEENNPYSDHGGHRFLGMIPIQYFVNVTFAFPRINFAEIIRISTLKRDYVNGQCLPIDTTAQVVHI